MRRGVRRKVNNYLLTRRETQPLLIKGMFVFGGLGTTNCTHNREMEENSRQKTTGRMEIRNSMKNV